MSALCKIPWTGWLTHGTGGWTFGRGVGVCSSSGDCGSDELPKPVPLFWFCLLSVLVVCSVRRRPVPNRAVLRKEPFRFLVLLCFIAAASAPPVALGLRGTAGPGLGASGDVPL